MDSQYTFKPQILIEFSVPVSPKEFYQVWLSHLHGAMVGSDAEISDEEGGSFVIWSGYITGRNLELRPYHSILQTWRADEFRDEDDDSLLLLELRETATGTDITLKHGNIPADLVKHYEAGWQEYYMQPIRDYF